MKSMIPSNITAKPGTKGTCVSIDEDEIELMAGSNFNVIFDLSQQRRPAARRNDVVRIFVGQTVVAKRHLQESGKEETSQRRRLRCFHTEN